MWAKLGDSDPFDGEEPRICVYLLSSKFTQIFCSFMNYGLIIQSRPLQFFALCSGPAVPLGEKLVPRTLLPDSAFCQERPVHSSWRNMGGNGKPTLKSPIMNLVIFYVLLDFTVAHFPIRMVICLQVSLWSGSFWKASASSAKSLESIAKR